MLGHETQTKSRDWKETCAHSHGNPALAVGGGGVCACLCWLGRLSDGPGGANTPSQPSQRSYCTPFTSHSTLTWLSKAKYSFPQRRGREEEKKSQQHCNCSRPKSNILKSNVTSVFLPSSRRIAYIKGFHTIQNCSLIISGRHTVLKPYLSQNNNTISGRY